MNFVILVQNFQMDAIYPRFLILHLKVTYFNKYHVDIKSKI